MNPPQGPQMEDFTLRERRHFSGGARGQTSSLGMGLVPSVDPPQSRKANLTAPVTEDISSGHNTSGSTVSTSGILQQPDATGRCAPSGQWQTSYQAMISNDSNAGKRPQGKKILSNQTAPGQSSLSSFLGYGNAPRRQELDIEALQMGTTKASGHIPGFTGHIQSTSQAAKAPVVERNLDKSLPLLTQGNYKPIPGYTGRRQL